MKIILAFITVLVAAQAMAAKKVDANAEFFNSIKQVYAQIAEVAKEEVDDLKRGDLIDPEPSLPNGEVSLHMLKSRELDFMLRDSVFEEFLGYAKEATISSSGTHFDVVGPQYTLSIYCKYRGSGGEFGIATPVIQTCTFKKTKKQVMTID